MQFWINTRTLSIITILLMTFTSCVKEQEMPLVQVQEKVSLVTKRHDRPTVEQETPPLANTTRPKTSDLSSNARTALGGNNALGVWLWYIEGTGYSSHAQLADQLASMGVNRIYVKVGDGTNQWAEATNTNLVQTYKARGIETWAWGYNYPGNVEAQADIVYQAAKTGYEGYVTDIEIEFDGKSTELHAILGEFREAISQAVTDGHTTNDFKLYCTSWGNPVDHGMRVDIIDQYVDAHMPQTYLEVWGSSYMSNATYWVNYGTQEYRDQGCVKPIHHIVSNEYDNITAAQMNEFIAASGAETSIWRIPGGESPLSIWNTLEQLNWQQDMGYESGAGSGAGTPTDYDEHWASVEISYMIDNGYMSGYGDGSFKPDNTLTRAEFASMIVATLNPAQKPEYASRSFNDISGHWAEAKILQAARAGYLSGYADGTFRPNDQITREQLFVSLAGNENIVAGCEALLDEYTDKGSISSWAKGGVADATNNKLVANYPTKTSLYPMEAAYRGEAVTALYQLMVLEGNAPAYTNAYTVESTITCAGGGGSSAGYIEGVPYFYQLNNSVNPSGSCQNTGMAMVLRYYGANVTPDEISNYYGTSQAQTVSGFETVFNSEAAYFGLNVRDQGTTTGTIQQLQQLVAEGKPVVAHGYTTGYGHLIVFLGFDGEYYTVHDPYGKWNQVPYSSGYTNTSTAGKLTRYHKDAIRDAFAPDGYVWLHEIVFTQGN
ncbi:S-layer homology domain-containing protein [Algivirga pacifica]|uniref:SLH domain-containing protein n=1 Tax=Algivirga pacifica TaxID=1162670 RepID=A0ABP9D6P3_9BACT